MSNNREVYFTDSFWAYQVLEGDAEDTVMLRLYYPNGRVKLETELDITVLIRLADDAKHKFQEAARR